jgi:hypothetical protein
LIQAYPDLSVAQLIDAVQNSSSQATNPDDNLGYGIPNFGKVFSSLSNQQIVQQDHFNYYVKDKILFFDFAPGESKLPFQLFNLQGQLLIELNSLQTGRVDLQQFSNGIYIFRLAGMDRGFKVVI